MFINFEKIKQYPELIQILKETHGNILPDILNEMIDTFGGDFEVVIKYYSHDRQIIMLDDLQVLEDTNPDLYDDIQEVFIYSDDYNYIMDNIEEE